jgi:DNA-directed RNA polymerase specialized sigma24 family protein
VNDDLDVFLPAIAAGDATAFARWLAGGEPLVRRALRSFAARVDVEAVVQEALLRAWQVAPRVVADGRPNGLLRLAIRSARNLAIDESRRSGRFVDDDAAEETEEGPAPAPPDPFLREQIAICWDRVPDKPRSALHARLESAGDGTDTDLAARCGMRLNTFLQNVGRARKHLVACLEAHGIRLDAHLSPGGAP